MALYPTRFSDNSFKICSFNLKLTRFAIDIRGRTIWNKFLTESEESFKVLFKKYLKIRAKKKF